MNSIKFITTVLFFLFLVPVNQPAFCIENTGSSKQRIFDEAELLSESDRSAVQRELDKVSSDLGRDFVIVTKKQLDGTRPRTFAENFFHSQGFGQPHGTGAILLISMAERDYYFATFGSAMKDYDARSSTIQRRIQKLLSAGDYRGAFLRFAQLMRPAGFFDKFLMAAATWPPLVISLILTLIIVGFLAYNHRGAITVTSSTYARPGAFKLISTEDRYLRTTTSKTRIQSNKSSGSSGGSRSSGGGGGKF